MTSSFDKFKVPESEMEDLINSYHPVKLEHPETRLSHKGVFAQMQAGQMKQGMGTYLIEKKLIRLKIPI